MKPKLLVLIVFIAACGAFSPEAYATPKLPTYLSITTGKFAITAYEKKYWGNQYVHLTVNKCRRQSFRQITCRTTMVRADGFRAETIDWATNIGHHGLIRVHPGQFNYEIKLS